MTSVTVSPKFQVVIPKAVRESLGIVSGQKIQVLTYRHRIELIPLKPMEEMRGFLKGIDTDIPRDVDRMLRGARSMREASISSALLVWERISNFASEIGYPMDKLGVNVEYLDSRNPRSVDASFELAEEFGRIFRKRIRT